LRDGEGIIKVKKENKAVTVKKGKIKRPVIVFLATGK
jgi:hypothetical protein